MVLGRQWKIVQRIYVPERERIEDKIVFERTFQEPIHPVALLSRIFPIVPKNDGWYLHDAAWDAGKSEVGAVYSLPGLLARIVAVNNRMDEILDMGELNAYRIDGNRGFLIDNEYDGALIAQGVVADVERVPNPYRHND